MRKSNPDYWKRYEATKAARELERQRRHDLALIEEIMEEDDEEDYMASVTSNTSPIYGSGWVDSNEYYGYRSQWPDPRLNINVSKWAGK